MKDINELKDRMDSTDEIIEHLVKKTGELEKQAANITALHVPEHTALLEMIMKTLHEIKAASDTEQARNLLNDINQKLEKLPKSSHKNIRFLLFPETNQAQYYKIVFGRLIPWGLTFMFATYIFITGYKALAIYRYNVAVDRSIHYQRPLLYLQQHSKKKVLSEMDKAYNYTADK